MHHYIELEGHNVLLLLKIGDNNVEVVVEVRLTCNDVIKVVMHVAS